MILIGYKQPFTMPYDFGNLHLPWISLFGQGAVDPPEPGPSGDRPGHGVVTNDLRNIMIWISMK